MEKPGERRTDSGGYWRGSSARWSGGECSGGVRGQPLSLMKANRPGRRRRVPQEESQSAGPNEPRLEIRGRQREKKKKRNKSEGWTEEGRSAELIRLFFFWLREKHDIDRGKSWK